MITHYFWVTLILQGNLNKIFWNSIMCTFWCMREMYPVLTCFNYIVLKTYEKYKLNLFFLLKLKSISQNIYNLNHYIFIITFYRYQNVIIRADSLFWSHWIIFLNQVTPPLFITDGLITNSALSVILFFFSDSCQS